MKKYLPTSYVHALKQLLATRHDPQDVAQSLVRQLTKRKSLRLLPEIVKELSEITTVDDVPRIDLTVARTPSHEVKTEIKKLITRTYGDEVEIREHTNAALLGGFTLRQGDNVTDYSVANLLKQLQSFIQHTPV